MPGTENSLSETRPSVFSPTSTMAKSFSIATIVPRITAPSVGGRTEKLSSSRAAKSSRLGDARADSFVCAAARAIKFLRSKQRCRQTLRPADFQTKLLRRGRLSSDSWRSGSKRRCRVSSTPGLRLERFLDLGSNQSEGGRQCGVYIQIRSVEQVGVGGRTHRRNRTIPVGRIPSAKFRQKREFVALDPKAPEFEQAPKGAHLGARIDKELRRCIRTDDGSYIPAIHNSTVAASRRMLEKRTLKCEQCFAYGRYGCHLGRSLPAHSHTDRPIPAPAQS